MRHGFNTEIAVQYGVHAAIVLDNLYFWIRKNTENKKNYHEGRYWTYNSKKALAESFPYLTARQIEYALNKLVDGGVLLAENYNESKYDRTLWYALTDFGYSILQNCEMETTKLLDGENKNVESIQQNCGMEETKLCNRNNKIVEPIPDNKPDITPDEKPVNFCGDGGRGRTRASEPYPQDNQAMSLEVGAVKTADNHPTHSLNIIQYGDYPTTETELQQVKAFTAKLFKQYRRKGACEADIQRVFEFVYRRQELPNGEAIAVFDQQKAALLEYAFEQGAAGNGTSWRYIDGIYKNFANRGIETLEDAQEYEFKRQTGCTGDIMAKFFEE